MTKEEAIATAEEFGRRIYGWPGIVHAVRMRRWILFGRHVWRVSAMARGPGIVVVVDDESGEILSYRTGPKR